MVEKPDVKKEPKAEEVVKPPKKEKKEEVKKESLAVEIDKKKAEKKSKLTKTQIRQYANIKAKYKEGCCEIKDVKEVNKLVRVITILDKPNGKEKEIKRRFLKNL